MNRIVISILILFILFGGCRGNHNKTKEQLLSEGIKLSQQNDLGSAAIIFKNALEKDPNYFEARFLLAKAYYAIGKLDSAEKELEKVRRQNPSSRDVQHEIARVLAHTNRPDEALQELSKYLGDDSTDCDALEIAGWAYAVKKNYPESITLLKKSVATCGGVSEPIISLAAVYAMTGDLQEAEIQLNHVLGKEPTNRKALYLLSDIQIRRGEKAAALKTLDTIIQTDQNDIEAKYRKGLLYIELGDYDNARASSNVIVKQFPNRPEGIRLEGFILFFKKQYRDAVAPLQKSLLIQPSVGSCYVLGLSYYYLNETEQAMNQFQKALDLNPSIIRARVYLALTLLDRQRVDDAINELNRALSQDSDDAFAHNILGSAYLAKGNYAEGLAELNKSLALDPALVDVHIKKGLLALKQGKGQEAESELVSALSIKPEATDAQRMLAIYYINKNEPSKAMNVLKKNIQNGRSDAVSYYLMAESYLQSNNIADAIAYYQKVKVVDQKYYLAYFKLASIYLMQGRQEKSVRELQNLLEHDPDNVQAMLLLASIAELNAADNEALKNILRAADTGKSDGVVAAAWYLQRTGNSEKALKVINEGIKQAPTDDNLNIVKGEILLANRKFKEAVTTFDAVERSKPQLGFKYLVNTYLAMGEYSKAQEKVQAEIKKNPTNLSLRADLSRIYDSMGNRADAIENARDIIRKYPAAPIGYLTLARIYQSSNDVDKSIVVLRDASGIKDANIPFTLANLYILKKDYAAALGQSRKAENEKAGSEQILFQKGTIFYSLGKRQEAEEEYFKVLRLSPNHAMALNNLAYLYVQENKSLTRALNFATQAFLLEPQNDYIRDTLGYVLLKKGEINRGIQMLRKASVSSPKNPNILYHLALAYKESGDSERAVENLQKAIELGEFQEISEAKSLLARIKNNGKT